MMEGRSFLILQEALEQKKAVVYETKSVNELSIENRSDQDIYVQAGDIVKGGQQDRVLAVDLIVPPGLGRMPIAAEDLRPLTLALVPPSRLHAESSDGHSA